MTSDAPPARRLEAGTAASSHIVFVTQAGEIERQAVLLAASLRRHLGPGVRLVAAKPSGEGWMTGPLQPASIETLKALDVEIVPFAPPMPHYPQGNKIGALMALPDSADALFLDTDMLCLRPFEATVAAMGEVALCPAGRPWQGGEEHWPHLYRLFDLPPPSASLRARVTGEPMAPYFNAGGIHLADAGRFARCWLETCLAIDADERVPQKRPWLDQIALPVAIARSDRAFSILPEALNFPAHRKPAVSGTVLAHYHHLDCIGLDRRMAREVAGILDDHPAVRRLLPDLGHLDALPMRLGRICVDVVGKQSARKVSRRLRRHMGPDVAVRARGTPRR